jgi:hypothetical protein
MNVHVNGQKISSVYAGRTPHRGRTLAYEEPSGTALLSVVIIRLLALALAVEGRRAASSANRRVSLPADYARWPAIECGRRRGDARESVTFYVNPKGAATLDDQAFPGGTVFVMETYAIRSAWRKDLVQIFVMEKEEGAAHACHADAEADAWQGATIAP